MKSKLLSILFIIMTGALYAQTNIVTYAGATGKETFFDANQITDGTFLNVGYAENLNWTGNAPKIQLSYSASIPNG